MSNEIKIQKWKLMFGVILVFLAGLFIGAAI